MKAEFKRRLGVLLRAILDSLATDSVDKGLLPALYSVFSYMWCKNPRDLSNYKKFKK